MVYGYARCSTSEKEQDVNRQVRELKQMEATDKTIYREYESGMKSNRAELSKLLDIVQSGDTIIATEVSRITRSTKQLCDMSPSQKNGHKKRRRNGMIREVFVTGGYATERRSSSSKREGETQPRAE